MCKSARSAILILAVLVAGGCFVSEAEAARFRTLYTFIGGSDGARPSAGLLRDAVGNLYGVTSEGGGAGCGGAGCGTVFRLAPDGAEIILYAFTGGADGAKPASALIQDADGNLYGTTPSGGRNCNNNGGCGVIFKLTPDGHETVLYAFSGGADGASPNGRLAIDQAGNLFGTASEGGDLVACYKGCGTVFEVRADGKEKTLYTFHSGSDGTAPAAGLILDDIGNLYGTASAAGGLTECGTVFRLSPDGTETALHTFGESDGCNPAAPLVMDSRGNLYGTTLHGGNTSNAACGSYFPYGCGVVFRLSPKGALKRLHKFNGKDGDEPYGVVQDAMGNLFGTTALAVGIGNFGTLYERPALGKFSVLHNFSGASDGAFPAGDVAIAENGKLYGTASAGGHSKCQCGVVFAFRP